MRKKMNSIEVESDRLSGDSSWAIQHFEYLRMPNRLEAALQLMLMPPLARTRVFERGTQAVLQEGGAPAFAFWA